MILSRVTKAFRLFNLSQTNYFLESYGGYKKSPLQISLEEAASFKDFFNIYSQNKVDFTADVLANCSRKINTLLKEERDFKEYERANDLLSSIEGLKMESLQQKSLINIFSIFKKFERKGLNGNFYKAKLKTLQAYSNLIRDKQYQDYKDIQNLIFYYHETANFFYRPATRITAEKLCRLLENLSGSFKQKIPITMNQISYFFSGLAICQEIDAPEKRLRSILLQKVKSELTIINHSDLISIALELNKMDQIDFNYKEMNAVRAINQHLNELISDLDEPEIRRIMSYEYNEHNFTNFKYIYTNVLGGILNEIDLTGQKKKLREKQKLLQNGGKVEKGKQEQVQNSPQSIFDLAVLSSSKIKLNQSSVEAQKNFFGLLDKILSQKLVDPFKIINKLNVLVERNFFDNSHKDQLVQILNKNNVDVSINLLYSLAVRNYKIADLIKQQNFSTIINNKFVLAVKLGTALHRSQKAQNKSHVQQLIKIVDPMIKEAFSTPELFNKHFRLMTYQQNYSQLVNNFHRMYSDVFQAMPNPFQVTPKNNNYSTNYVDYLISASQHSNNLQEFFKKNQSSLEDSFILSIIQKHLRESKKTITPNKDLLNFLHKKFNSFLQTKNVNLIEAACNLLVKYNRSVVYHTIYSYTEQSCWKLLAKLISKHKQIKQLKAEGYVYRVWSMYMNRNFKNYNIEMKYKHFMEHLLTIIPEITANNRMIQQIVRNALRLNIITKNMSEFTNYEVLRLNWTEKEKLKKIFDSKYVTPITNLNPNNLEIIFFNENCSEYVEAHSSEILEQIKTLNNYQLGNILLNFSLPNNHSNRVLLNAILQKFTEQCNNFQGINIIGIFENALSSNVIYQSGYSKLLEKVLTFLMKNKMRLISIESHFEILRFITTQHSNFSKISHPYFKALVEYTETQVRSENYKLVLYQKLSLTNYKFSDTEVKKIEAMLDHNDFAALNFFLMHENRYEDSDRSKYMVKIVEILKKSLKNTAQKKYKIISNINYKYIKLVYPEETKDLNIPEENQYPFKFAQKPNLLLKNFINEIVTSNNLTETTLPQFGNENSVFRLKDIIYFFVFQSKSGSIYEQEYFKKMVKVIIGEDIPVYNFISVNSSERQLLELFNKNNIFSDPKQFQEMQKKMNTQRDDRKKYKDEKGDKKTQGKQQAKQVQDY